VDAAVHGLDGEAELAGAALHGLVLAAHAVLVLCAVWAARVRVV
jgi:hypothetical protein